MSTIKKEFEFPPQHHGLYKFDSDEDNRELADKVDKNEEQPWKRWFLVSDEHPLEAGKYNFGGIIVHKPPAIIQDGYFSKEKVFHPKYDGSNTYKPIKVQNDLIISNWIRLYSFDEIVDKHIINIIIKYLLFIPLTWHKASQEVTQNDGTLEIIKDDPSTIRTINVGVNIALMNYICDWNYEYIDCKNETFGIKLKLTSFNNPYAFGFGFIVINHQSLTPYISDWNYFMDYNDTNVGFGVFFVRQQHENNDSIDNKYQMKAFCEPRLYQNYMMIRKFQDGLITELSTNDEIKFILNHKTDISTLYINNNKISDIFFGAPPVIAPAIHYVGAASYFGFASGNPVQCTFQCDFASDVDDHEYDNEYDNEWETQELIIEKLCRSYYSFTIMTYTNYMRYFMYTMYILGKK